MSKKEKRLTVIILGVIISVSIFLHFFRISKPSSPVFDESHFATYSADNISKKIYFDIHPPLGTLIYSSILTFAPWDNLKDSVFITATKGLRAGEVRHVTTRTEFGSFPYVSLRTISALFGILLIPAFYLFLRSIGLGNVGSLLGAVFVALENTLLLDTRLILLNGIYLFFGILSLAFYFKYSPKILNAGILWGLSLSTKLTGIIFLGPVLIDRFFSNEKKEIGEKRWLKFIATGILVLILIVAGNYFFFPAREKFIAWHNLGFPLINTGSSIVFFLKTFLFNISFSIAGYLAGAEFHFAQSPWYLWPIMYKPIIMAKSMILVGNPAVWLSSTVAVVISLLTFFKLKTRRLILEPKTQKTFYILLGGYIFSLLPFLIVQRSTFIYHYYPALLFAIGLLAWQISRRLKLNRLENINKSQIILLATIMLICAFGFLLVAPLTYGTDNYNLPIIKPLIIFLENLSKAY